MLNSSGVNVYFIYKNGTSIIILGFDFAICLAPEIFPIMLVLRLILSHTYYAKNFAGVVDSGLYNMQCNKNIIRAV